MADIAIFRINYKSDFILTLQSDAGWLTPFCIKFWTGAPSQAYFAGYDGTTYTHCAPVDGDPTKLSVQFDDHHLPIGDMKFQIGYHFTVADFPTSIEDEVINQAAVIIDNDGEQQQVMLDFNGETAPEIAFAMPAYANEAQRIANEQARIAAEEQRVSNEEGRISAEESRQENEQQRIHNEETRIAEFASLKAEAIAATGAANDAATFANEKAQLAADKAELADDAATLANAKAQLAADKAALADAAATLANDKAALAQQKAEYAQTQGDYAKAQSDIALADHERAETDHERAEADHDTATDDHTTATSDHTQAESDHTRAEADHTTAASDHTQASSDHSTATSDHTQAGQDHTRAESDHTTAAADHTRAESDHAAVEAYVDSLGAFDISAYHATGSVLAKYADLTAALGTNGANIPDELRKGGMSVKFVLSSDNKYVQHRYMGTSIANADFLNVANWQGVDEEPTVGSKNLVESGGVNKRLEDINLEINGVKEIGKSLFWQDGYVDAYGTVRSSSVSIFCQPIELKAGETIEYRTNADYRNAVVRVNNINTISVGDNVGTDAIITYMYDAVGTTVRYTAGENMYIVISLYKTNYTLSFKKYRTDPININSRINTNYFTGAGSTFQTARIKLIKGRKYRIVLDNPSYARDNIGTVQGIYIFEIFSNDGSASTTLIAISNMQDTGALNKYYDFVVPQDSEYIGVGGRANEGVKVLFSVYDVTEIYQLEESITNTDNAPTLGSDNLVKSGGVFNAIAPLSANIVFKDDCYYDSNMRFVLNNNWYVGALVPVQQGDVVRMTTASDIDISSPQKLAVADENGNFFDYYAMHNNRTVTLPDTAAYIAMSVRKQDANNFKLYVNNALKYEGISDLSKNIPFINKRIDDIEPKYDIYSKNRDKLDLLRGASMRNSRLQVLIATDTHEDWTALQNAVDYANQCPNIKAVLALGDYGSATAGKAVFERFKEIAESSVKPILSIVGNHDAGFDNKLRFVALADSHYNYITEPSVKFLSSGEYAEGRNYYYHDFTTEKVRVIMLYEFETAITINSNDYWEPVTYESEAESYQIGKEYAIDDVVNFGLYTSNSFRCTQAHTSSASNEITCNNNYYRYFSQAQMEWFVSVLNSTPANYGVVICTHIPASSGRGNVIQRDKKFCDKRHNETDIYNFMVQDVLGIIVNAFTNGTNGSLSVTNTGGMPSYTLSYDFTNKNTGAKFMCFLSGHTHLDFIFKNAYSQYNITPIFSDSTTRQYATKDVPTVIDDMEVARDALTAVAFDLDNDGVILTRVGTTATTEGYLRDTERLDLTQ